VRGFDRVAVVDWSASATPSPAHPSPDALWIGVAADGGPAALSYHRTRAEAVAALRDLIAAALAAGERLLVGADFPFGWPRGLAPALTGRAEALALWDWLAARIEDGPRNRTNRFAVAAAINARLPGIGPFWGRPAGLDLPDLPEKGSARRGHGLPERRAVETLVRAAQPCWKLYTTGSVGSQALTGVAALARLRAEFPGRLAVWPLEPWAEAPVVLAEVYPSLLAAEVATACATDPTIPRDRRGAPIRDAAQVGLLARTLAALSGQGALAPLFAPPCDAERLREEAWILGAGSEAALRACAAGLLRDRLAA